MGTETSKQAEITGDAQVNIINQLQTGAEHHEQHEVKLDIVLGIVVALLMLKLYELYKKNINEKAAKRARASLEKCSSITIER